MGLGHPDVVLEARHVRIPRLATVTGARRAAAAVRKERAAAALIALLAAEVAERGGRRGVGRRALLPCPPGLRGLGRPLLLHNLVHDQVHDVLLVLGVVQRGVADAQLLGLGLQRAELEGRQLGPELRVLRPRRRAPRARAGALHRLHARKHANGCARRNGVRESLPHKRARMCPTNEHGGRKGGVAHRGKRKSGARGPRWKRTSWVPYTAVQVCERPGTFAAVGHSRNAPLRQDIYTPRAPSGPGGWSTA